mmetsp:Transcript_1219/g.1727  ORF Transcript_1219/g.1727 Transcript_1219/m.1727 type:complete len:162 (-) Transcript_1219:2190-2675(-)
MTELTFKQVLLLLILLISLNGVTGLNPFAAGVLKVAGTKIGEYAYQKLTGAKSVNEVIEELSARIVELPGLFTQQINEQTFKQLHQDAMRLASNIDSQAIALRDSIRDENDITNDRAFTIQSNLVTLRNEFSTILNNEESGLFRAFMRIDHGCDRYGRLLV